MSGRGPRRGPSAAAAFFDAIAGRYERAYALPAELSKRRLKRLLAELPPPPAAVLDLGVGTGRELAALQDARYQPTGIDVSRAMLERCARRSRPVPLVEADFWSPLPLQDASFDAAVALHGTLAHPPDDSAMPALAGEVARVVRPAGVWVIEVPSPAWLDAAASAPAPEGQRVRRTGTYTCVIEDEIASASIETRVYSAAEWNAALGPLWSVDVRAEDPNEWLIVARRAR